MASAHAHQRSRLTKQERLQRGIDGEEEFVRWLNSCERRFVRVDQSIETFAKLFAKEVKRPDFLVLLDSIGLIAVDVKNQAPQQDGCYTLSKDDELTKTLAFERRFRIPLWYAYFDRTSRSARWLWISALRAWEVGLTGRNREQGVEYLRIEPSQFAVLETLDDFGKLLSHGSSATTILESG